MPCRSAAQLVAYRHGAVVPDLVKLALHLPLTEAKQTGSCR